MDARGRQVGAPRVLPQQAGIEGFGPRDVITGLAFSSADDSVLAVSRSDGAVALVDVDSGQTLRILRGGRGRVEHMAFSPSGERLVAAHENGVDAWDVATGRRLPGHASTFSSDLAVGMTRAARWPPRPAPREPWRSSTSSGHATGWRGRCRCPAAGGTADTVVASPDGRALVAMNSLDGQRGAAATRRAAPTRALPSRDATTFLHFSEDGRRLLVCCGAGFDTVLRLKDLRGKTLESFGDDAARAFGDAVLARSGRLLVLGHWTVAASLVLDPRRANVSATARGDRRQRTRPAQSGRPLRPLWP